MQTQFSEERVSHAPLGVLTHVISDAPEPRCGWPSGNGRGWEIVA